MRRTTGGEASGTTCEGGVGGGVGGWVGGAQRRGGGRQGNRRGHSKTAAQQQAGREAGLPQDSSSGSRQGGRQTAEVGRRVLALAPKPLTRGGHEQPGGVGGAQQRVVVPHVQVKQLVVEALARGEGAAGRRGEPQRREGGDPPLPQTTYTHTRPTLELDTHPPTHTPAAGLPGCTRAGGWSGPAPCRSRPGCGSWCPAWSASSPPAAKGAGRREGR